VESYRLTPTDVIVLRVAVRSLIAPVLEAPFREQLVSTNSTLPIAIWQESPRDFPPFGPPPPPPPFAGSGERTKPSRSPGLRDLDATLLSPSERVAWDQRNREIREVPDLTIAGLGSRRRADGIPYGWKVVEASAPCYPTQNTAVLYVHYTCPGGCGEGRLIRLGREGPSWRTTASQRLWIG
jgi:hypothetical protein